jgi:hypothetical protein
MFLKKLPQVTVLLGFSKIFLPSETLVFSRCFFLALDSLFIEFFY